MQSLRHLLHYLLPVALAVWLPASAATETASENAVRAVLLYNFLKFADLPANGSEQRPLTICVTSSDPDLLAAMEQLQDRQVRGRSLVVQAIKQDSECDAIYVASRAHWQFIADKPGTSRALTVGVYPGFLNDGGIVEVDFQQNRPRFDINLAHARRAGIRLYPQLLRLARRVIE